MWSSFPPAVCQSWASLWTQRQHCVETDKAAAASEKLERFLSAWASAATFLQIRSWIFHLTSVPPMFSLASLQTQPLLPGRGELLPSKTATTKHSRQRRLAYSGHTTTSRRAHRYSEGAGSNPPDLRSPSPLLIFIVCSGMWRNLTDTNGNKICRTSLMMQSVCLKGSAALEEAEPLQRLSFCCREDAHLSK